MYRNVFTPENVQLALDMLTGEFPKAVWDTLWVTVLSTLASFVLGLPLGIFLVTGDEKGINPKPRWLMKTIGSIINLLRSIPFLILMVLVVPLSRVLIGTSVGTKATVIPLVAAAFPFIARLAESCLREVDPNLIETAQSMGATNAQIIWKVMIPEAKPSLISNGTTAITTILGYTAMAGTIGGGGLGAIAINYGYYRGKLLVMLIAVIFLVILVQVFQSAGTNLAVKSDKRLKK